MKAIDNKTRRDIARRDTVRRDTVRRGTLYVTHLDVERDIPAIKTATCTNYVEIVENFVIP